MTPFADRLVRRVRELKTPLCVGLDPHLASIPPEFGVRPAQPTSAETAAAVRRFFGVVLEECAGRVAVVKPQIAFFEQLGWRGLQALEAIVHQARDAGLLVLMDAKRGDIGSTARAYADAFLRPESPWPADAVTLNPYLGLDSLEPFLAAARDHGSGLFVLARTSNPGSGDFQDRTVEGLPLYLQVARALAPASRELIGQTGWSSLGIVAGATYPAEARSLRAELPHALFLVPGYGAQGGSAGDAVAGFVPRGSGDGGAAAGAPVAGSALGGSPTGGSAAASAIATGSVAASVGGEAATAPVEGGLVNSSRGILYGATGGAKAGGDCRLSYRQGLRQRLQTANAELSAAVAPPPFGS